MPISRTDSRRRAAIRACAADLRASGVDLSPWRLGAVVREHLDYFQLMIGGCGVECPSRQVLAMLRAESGAAASAAACKHPVN
jgi:hypothetical protein